MIRKRRKENPETPIVKIALAMLARDYGGKQWKVNSGSRNHARFVAVDGHPDIAGYDQTGRAIYAEVKTHDGELTEDQHVFLHAAHWKGAIALVVIGAENGESAAVYTPVSVPQKYVPKAFRTGAA